MKLILGDFFYGIQDPATLRPLPPRWQYVQDAYDFLKAQSPDKRLWFVKSFGVSACKIATPQDVFRTSGALRFGDQFEGTERRQFPAWRRAPEQKTTVALPPA